MHFVVYILILNRQYGLMYKFVLLRGETNPIKILGGHIAASTL